MSLKKLEFLTVKSDVGFTFWEIQLWGTMLVVGYLGINAVWIADGQTLIGGGPFCGSVEVDR